MQYGKTGQKSAPSYRSPAPKQQAKVAVSNIRITVLLNDVYEDVNVRAASELGARNGGLYPIKYILAIQEKHLFLRLRAEWTAAQSSELQEQLLLRHKDKVIRFGDDGSARYEIQSKSEPVLRSGMLILQDQRGQSLGAAYAPAYTSSK